MPTPIAIVLVVAIGYGLGSVPVANLVARRHGLADLRAEGDHNPGFWNAFELLGVRAALPIFAGDVAKGAVAAAVGRLLAENGQWWMPYLGAGAAMVGHAFPAFASLRGGRSVLAFVGGGLVFAPLPAIIAVGALTVIWIATRRFDWAARTGVAAFPAMQIVLQGAERTALTGALMTFIGLRFMTATRTDPATGPTHERSER